MKGLLNISWLRRLLNKDAAVDTVTCHTHGTVPGSRVCQHIVSGLIAKERVGFFWTTEDPDAAHPDAWCMECENRVRKTGGEWTDEAHAQLRPQVLCSHCYELAKTFHMGGDPWS